MHMAQSLPGLALLACCVWSSASATSAPAAALQSYQWIKGSHESFLAAGPTKTERLEAMRALVRSSRYGDRGLQTLLHNLEGRYAIDPGIQGVETSARLLNSSNLQQRKGHMRQLVYASNVHADPRFRLEAMNQLRVRQWGMTDADIVIRHRSTGIRTRLEVKDVSLSSQQRNLGGYKVQIDKMARERRSTGELQYWVNRRPTLGALEKYAEQKKVPIFGSVTTGQHSKGVPFGQVLGRIERDSVQAHSRNLRRPVVQAASATAVSGLRLGTATRTAFLLYGGMIAVDEVTSIWKYSHGEMNSREFWTSQWVIGASASGMYIGSWLGATLGASTLNPMALGGMTIIGGLAMASASGWLASQFADLYYDFKFQALNEEYGKYLYERYGVVSEASETEAVPVGAGE